MRLSCQVFQLAHKTPDTGACWLRDLCAVQTFYWSWYCSGREQGSSLQSFMRAFITGWLPSLLLNLWLAMVMPRLVYLIVQVCDTCGLACHAGIRPWRVLSGTYLGATTSSSQAQRMHEPQFV